MKNISMRTECGFLSRTVGNRPSFNRGQGNATSVVDVEEEVSLGLIQMTNEADISSSDKIYQRLINNHVTQDSRCQSLPTCVEKHVNNGVESKNCDQGPRSKLQQPGTNCDLMPSVCDKSKEEVEFDINGTTTDSWFKTWPETRNIINTQTQKIVAQNSESPRKSFRQQSCDENRNCESNVPLTSNIRPSTAIPLDQLLQSIPLAYSPITRQLHVLSPPAHSESQQQDASKLTKNEDGEESLGCVLKSGSPFSSLSSLSGAEFCGPSTPSNDDDSSDTTSTSLVSDVHINKNLLGTKLKQGTFSNFFSRGLFNWKLNKTGCESEVLSCEDRSSSSLYAWKIFNRTGHAHSKEDTLSLDEACSSASSSCSSNSHAHFARFPSLEASSGALILEPRPSHLPAKSHEEEQRHQLQYQQMVQAAKKKELKEAKLRKKQLQQQLKAEDQLAQAARIWSSEILPKWESMKGSRKARDLWWQGLPPCVRGKVWRLAVGNELNLTPDLYEICVTRAQERLRAVETNSDLQEGKQCGEVHNPDKESSVELIQLDIARTFPLLCIFQKGGPYYDVLHSLLGAYVCYRPDVGYIQGMSFIAAVLILNLEVAEAFVCFANMLNRSCQRAFFHLDEPIMHAYYAAYDEVFQESLPRLHKHFGEQSLTPDLYLLDWLYTMFSRSMPLDLACRVWDVYLRDGEEFLFRTALGVLHLYQDSLLSLDFLHGAQFLNKLPDDISSDALFRSIEGIRMCVGKMKFVDILTRKIELARAAALDSS